MQPVKVWPTRPDESGLRPVLHLPDSGPQIVFVALQGMASYRSIEEAVRESEPGTRIVVRPGVYHESLVLDRRVQIVGEGPVEEIIVHAVKGPCVLMQTAEAAVRG